MRQFMSLCLLAFVCWSPCRAAADEARGGRFTTPDRVDFSILPTDIEALRELDSRHRSLARRAANMCLGPGATIRRAGLYNDPCVVRSVASGLELAESPELTAFHYAVPLRVRYDGLRTEVDWRQAVDKKIRSAKAGG